MPTNSRAEFLRLGLAAAAAAFLPGCGGASALPDGVWANAARTRSSTPRRIARPGCLEEVVELVRAAQKGRISIRAVGSGHSFSDVALTDGILVLPDGLTRVLSVDRASLRDEKRCDASLFRVESGIPIRALNRALDEQGRALENMGGYDAQTLVGAVSTGTHGSGLRYGPFSSWLESMDVVGAGGAVFRVEPSRGMTDPSRFRGTIETSDGEAAATLVQDDDVFQSMVVSMGCMGIVYAVTFRTVPKYWMRERRTLLGWRELARPGGMLDLIARGRAPEADHYEILVNPYAHREPYGKDDRSCLITERTRLDRPTVYDYGERPRKSDFWPRFVVSTGASEATVADAVGLLSFGAVAGAIDASLDGMRAGCQAEYEAVSYRVFALGALNEFRAWGTEFSFDLSETIRAAERVFVTAYDEARRYRRYHPAPISLRFVKRAAAYLSPQYGRDTCMIELPSLVGLRGASQLFARHARELIGGEPPVRPHWGLDLDALSGSERVKALYPKWAEWERVYRRFNVGGLFNGPFTRRLGISV